MTFAEGFFIGLMEFAEGFFAGLLVVTIVGHLVLAIVCWNVSVKNVPRVTIDENHAQTTTDLAD